MMDYRVIGNSQAKICLIEPIGEWDNPESLYREIAALCPEKEFFLVPVRVNCWNGDLCPWVAPPVFGKDGFGCGAADTLSYIENIVFADIPARDKHVILGGYSLAGLFSLWAVANSDEFSACAAASPSVWFPGWIEYASSHPPKTDAVYLSLGDKEEHTRNQTMARVGDCIRRQDALLSGIQHTLVWNEGNHFRDAALRMAKGFAWCMNRVG